MNELTEAKLIKGLQDLCSADEVADRLFTAFAQRKNDASETSVRLAAQTANAAKSSVLNVFKQLHALGVGDLIWGRHGYETRMAWKFSIRSLGRIAQGKSSVPEKVEPSAKAEDIEEEAALSFDHEFLLRPGFKVGLKLPPDLNEREAERLATFIRSLPL